MHMHMSDRMNPLFVVVRHRTHMRRDVAILLNLTFKFFVNFLSRSVRIDSLLCDYNFWVCALHFDCLRDSKEKSRARMCVCVCCLYTYACVNLIERALQKLVYMVDFDAAAAA